MSTISNASDLSANIIDATDGIKAMLESLRTLKAIYLDLEGINLSRHGTISLVQIWDDDNKQAYIVDVHVLGTRAFNTPCSSGETLKTILESRAATKYFFDVRNDSDALFNLFDVQLKSVRDVQLMELAARRYSKKYISGLAKCIEMHACLDPQALEKWKNTKTQGRSLLAPERGGSYDVFNTRPLPRALIDYAVGDIVLLPTLVTNYEARISMHWMGKVDNETEERLKESRKATFTPNGKNKTIGPRRWQKWK